MARERKPLIEPGSVLPATDTLSRILERDRVASGRKSPALSSDADPPHSAPGSDARPSSANGLSGPTPEAKTLHDVQDGDITSNITAHTPANKVSQSLIHTDAQPPVRPSTQTDAKASVKMGTKKSSKLDAEEAVQTRVRLMAASRAVPITLRMPEELNDWLDEYAHTHRKQGVKKQDLIARAVQLLVIDLSADIDGGEGDAA